MASPLRRRAAPSAALSRSSSSEIVLAPPGVRTWGMGAVVVWRSDIPDESRRRGGRDADSRRVARGYDVDIPWTRGGGIPRAYTRRRRGAGAGRSGRAATPDETDRRAPAGGTTRYAPRGVTNALAHQLGDELVLDVDDVLGDDVRLDEIDEVRRHALDASFGRRALPRRLEDDDGLRVRLRRVARLALPTEELRDLVLRVAVRRDERARRVVRRLVACAGIPTAWTRRSRRRSPNFRNAVGGRVAATPRGCHVDIPRGRIVARRAKKTPRRRSTSALGRRSYASA